MNISKASHHWGQSHASVTGCKISNKQFGAMGVCLSRGGDNKPDSYETQKLFGFIPVRSSQPKKKSKFPELKHKIEYSVFVQGGMNSFC
mgnify:CR=1 FL=1